jgi:hypothetical protein
MNVNVKVFRRWSSACEKVTAECQNLDCGEALVYSWSYSFTYTLVQQGQNSEIAVFSFTGSAFETGSEIHKIG